MNASLTDTSLAVPIRRRALLAAALATLGALLAGLRWWLQRAHLDGEGNVYTALERRFYESDPLLGFEQTADSWLWLGLDVIGVLAALAIAIGVFAMLVPRLAARLPRATRVASWLAIAAGAATFVPAVAAFASGMPPAGVAASVPGLDLAGAGSAGSFATGTAGTYQVTSGAVSTVVGQVTAGGETFDVTFTPITGSATFDPTALTSPVDGRFVIDVSTLDSGVPLRSQHAREYLGAAEHPEIVLTVSGLDTATISDDGDAVSWTASGQLELMGATHTLPLRGQLVAIDTPEERDKLDLADETPAYLLRAELTLDIRETHLAAELEAFDAPTIPLTVRLLLVHTQATP